MQRCHTGGFKKIFWVVVMLGMAAALMYNILQLTRKYFDYPISVTLDVDHQQQLTFPSVTVCNMNPVKRSAWLAAQNAAVKHRRKRAAGSLRVFNNFLQIMRNFVAACMYLILSALG